MDQNDNHLPFLTVRETVSFAAALSTVDPKHLVHPTLVAAAEERCVEEDNAGQCGNKEICVVFLVWS